MKCVPGVRDLGGVGGGFLRGLYATFSTLAVFVGRVYICVAWVWVLATLLMLQY